MVLDKKYLHCFFEVPFKRLGNGKAVEKGWPCIIIWIVLGTICIGAFTMGLHYWGTKINWFTTVYFVGGLGWVPAVLCGLSHAYYRMCQTIYPYLDKSGEELEQQYKNSANLIFGYLGGGTFNVLLSMVIWIMMIITVILTRNVLDGERSMAVKFIYIFYVFIGIIFTSIPCAVIHFWKALSTLQKATLKERVLYQGAAEQLRRIHTNCSLLIWGITTLLVLLLIAMFSSPYHEILWIWLPLFGFIPCALFIKNGKLTNSLLGTALVYEEGIIQKEINNILQAVLTEQKEIALYSLMGIREKLKSYTQSKITLANTLLLLFTILGAVGSCVAAGLSILTSGAEYQKLIPFLALQIYKQ